jgi:hypothetical protein
MTRTEAFWRILLIGGLAMAAMCFAGADLITAATVLGG